MTTKIIEHIPSNHVEAWRYFQATLARYPKYSFVVVLMNEFTADMLTDMRSVNKRSIKSKLYFELSKDIRNGRYRNLASISTLSEHIDAALQQMPNQRRKRSILPLLEKVVELMIACNTCEDLQSVGYALEDLIEGLIHKP